jgi:hypothetical protein
VAASCPIVGVVAALATTLGACSIVTNLDGLSQGAGTFSDAGAAVADEEAGDVLGAVNTSDAAADTPSDGPGANDGADGRSAPDVPTDGAVVNDGADSNTPGVSDAPSDSPHSDSEAPAIVRVQAIAPGWQSSSSTTLTFRENAGDLLVAAVYFTDYTVGIAVADTLGNTWTSTTAFANIRACGSNSATVAQIFYSEGVAAGDNVVTVTQSSGDSPLGAFLVEYSGVRATGSLDCVVGGPAPSSTSMMSPGSLTTTGAVDLVVALFAEATTSGVITPGSGFATAAGDPGFYSMLEDDVPAGVALGTVTPSATEPGGLQSDCWVAAAAAFRAAP